MLQRNVNLKMLSVTSATKSDIFVLSVVLQKLKRGVRHVHIQTAQMNLDRSIVLKKMKMINIIMSLVAYIH